MTAPLITILLAVALVTAVWWSIPALTKPTTPFGVRVPPESTTHAAVVTARAVHGQRVVGLGVVAAVIGMPLAFTGATTLVLPVLTAALVVADAAVYLLAHRSIRAAKRDGHWYAGTRQAVTADLSFRTDPVAVPWHWLAPALAVLVVTAIIGSTVYTRLPSTLPGLEGVRLNQGDRVPTTFVAAFTPVLTQTGLCLLLPLVALGLTRTRPDLDAAQPAASARRYRRYLRAIATMLFGVAALVNMTMLGIALRLWELVPPSVPMTMLTFLPLAATIVAAAVFQVRVGHAGHRLPAEPGEDSEDSEDSGMVQRDDDRHWYLGGFVYVNRGDPAIFVHQRVGGTSWTVNLGHPVGWISTVVLLGAVAALVVLSSFGVIDLPEK